MTPRQQTTLLVIGDCAVFLAFAVIGLRNHEEGVTLNGILRNAVPFGTGWFVFATLYGLMAPGWYRVPDAPWQRVANAWLPGWLLGLVLRSVYVWRFPVPVFAGIVLLTAGIMILLWRMAAAWLLRRSREPGLAKP